MLTAGVGVFPSPRSSSIHAGIAETSHAALWSKDSFSGTPATHHKATQRLLLSHATLGTRCVSSQSRNSDRNFNGNSDGTSGCNSSRSCDCNCSCTCNSYSCRKSTSNCIINSTSTSNSQSNWFSRPGAVRDAANGAAASGAWVGDLETPCHDGAGNGATNGTPRLLLDALPGSPRAAPRSSTQSSSNGVPGSVPREPSRDAPDRARPRQEGGVEGGVARESPSARGREGWRGGAADIEDLEVLLARPGVRVQRRGKIKVLRADKSTLRFIGDFYVASLRLPPLRFAGAVFATPLLLSLLFTCLYLLDLKGLYLDDSATEFFRMHGRDGETLADVGRGPLDPFIFTELFMFSLSLSTGLEPSIAPNSLYTLAVANLNALFAQLLFVFLSGAVFTRLSQPRHPVRSADVAVISPLLRDQVLQSSQSNRPEKARVLLMRYMIVGLDPCTLADVRIQVSYNFNAQTLTGSFFRVKEALQLVKDEDFSQMYGFVVRHVIDQTSPLFGKTQEDLEKEDASITLCVLGIEESSMQAVCHTKFYFFADKAIKWDAEFEDVLLTNSIGETFIDETRLHLWQYSGEKENATA